MFLLTKLSLLCSLSVLKMMLFSVARFILCSWGLSLIHSVLGEFLGLCYAPSLDEQNWNFFYTQLCLFLIISTQGPFHGLSLLPSTFQHSQECWNHQLYSPAWFQNKTWWRTEGPPCHRVCHFGAGFGILAAHGELSKMQSANAQCWFVTDPTLLGLRKAHSIASFLDRLHRRKSSHWWPTNGGDTTHRAWTWSEHPPLQTSLCSGHWQWSAQPPWGQAA